ncbi:MAG: flagellar hook-basal body complex protein FliE [Acidimicrobiales bacterium]
MSMVSPLGALSATSGTWPGAGTSNASPVTGTEATQPTAPTAPSGAGALGASTDNGFAGILGNAIDNVQTAQTSADDVATQAATGSLTNVSDYMVAAEEANLDTQLTVAVRNNALQAFQQIMGMQL